MPLSEKLQAARLIASERWPYISSTLWSLTPVETKGLGTLGVDKWWRLYYDPDLTWDVEECATVFYHESWHLLDKHPERAELQLDLDPQAWNICADAAINGPVNGQAGVKFPKGVVFPSTLKMPDNLLVEEYYESLPKLVINTGPCAGDCGSIAGGPKRPHELDGPISAGGKSDTTGLSPADQELMRHQVAHDIQTSSRGDIPDHIKKWAKEILEPTIDWRKALMGQFKRAMAEVAGQVDFTFKRLSRRQAISKRVILPAMMAPSPKVGIVIDTSGSMGDTGAACLAEVNGILKACGGKPQRVLSCDAMVHTSRKVFNASQVELIGGGGTDMGVGIAEAMRDRPHVIVVITDGYTPWPAEPYARVIVALVNKDESVQGPEWARTVRVTQ